MNGSLLLDTNVVIAILAQDPAVCQRLAEATEVFIPSIVLGELYYGARKSIRVESNVEIVDRFAAASRVLLCDSITAQHYGRFKNLLSEKGRPIPENDIWIAAIAEQHKLTLVSRDAHFNEVQGLPVEFW